MEIHKDIQNIIFDLGEVIVDLDFSKTEQGFQSLLDLPKEAVYSYQTQSKVFDLFERGKITSTEFRKELCILADKQLNDASIDSAWNAMLIAIPKDKIKLVQNLRLNYQTFVLSNTNEIHIDFVNQHLLPEHKLSNLDEIFDFVYYSHEIGERKPDLEAFQYIIEKHGILVSETLFIDDKLENILAAESLGLKTWHLTNRDDLLLIKN